jgi:hypothetical protein
MTEPLPDRACAVIVEQSFLVMDAPGVEALELWLQNVYVLAKQVPTPSGAPFKKSHFSRFCLNSAKMFWVGIPCGIKYRCDCGP